MSKKTVKLQADQTSKNNKGKLANPQLANQSTSRAGYSPWMSLRNGLILMGICSLVLAGLTAVQYVPALGLVKGILYGLLYGGMIWVVFLIALLVMRWLRR